MITKKSNNPEMVLGKDFFRLFRKIEYNRDENSIIFSNNKMGHNKGLLIAVIILSIVLFLLLIYVAYRVRTGLRKKKELEERGIII